MLSRILVVTGLILIAFTAPLSASQEHVADQSAIVDAVSSQQSDTDATRAAVQSLLDRPETRQIAEANGIDVTGAQDAVAAMSDAEIDALAPHVAQLDGALAGGDRIVISATAIIIILLILILIAVA